jgi:hypothetical protein
MSLMGPETKIDYTGETEEQFTQPTNHGSLSLEVNEWVLLESPPSEGDWPVVDSPFIFLKRRPNFEIHKSLGKNRNTVMGPDGTQNQDWLCWQRPAAVHLTDQQGRLGKNKNMVMGPGRTWNQDWLCWRRPAAIYLTDQPWKQRNLHCWKHVTIWM